MDREELYRKAIRKFGYQSQIDKAMEECSELITALCHARYDRASVNEVPDEIADVEIMCGQLRLLWGTGLVTERKRLKLDRLSKLLREENYGSTSA